MSLVTSREMELLRRLHAGRPYHNWKHIEAMLALIAEFSRHVSILDLLEAAICFHDVIYDSTKSDNEELSARFALETLGDRLSGPMADFLRAMILATKKHVVPDNFPTMIKSDIALLIDADLSILGSRPEEFARYDKAVREEYGWVSDAAWKTGRRDVLVGFLARPTIYLTAPMRDRFETQARENLTSAIELLS